MKTLFGTTTLGHRTLKNRVWRSATWMALADSVGNVTDALVSAYEELADGGAAVIVTGLTSVVAGDAEIGGDVKFFDDRFVSGHRRLTDAVHKHGALVMMQTAIVDGPIDGLRTEQVENIVRAFGDAAARAEQAGYDGAQIHAAHFFYLSKFFCMQSSIAERISPLLNHRIDRYGGDQRGRSRILCEILKDMRSKTSPAFLITMKINSTDEYPGGLTAQDFMLTSRLMADAGIDAIEVSANGTSRPLIREPNLINRWQSGDTAPSKCVSCNSCYRTPGHQCIFNLRNKQ